MSLEVQVGGGEFSPWSPGGGVAVVHHKSKKSSSSSSSSGSNSEKKKKKALKKLEKQQAAGAPPPVLHQPGPPPMGGPVVWMMLPPGIPPDCPPGLGFLCFLDSVLVEQQVEILEAITGFETENRYKILSPQRQQIYFAMEESTCCWRWCCGSRRKFKMKILDNNGHEVMRVERPWRCCGGCCCACISCCQYKLKIEAPPGETIAYASQVTGFCNFNFAIQNTEKESFAYVDGPCTACMLPCKDKKFRVVKDGVEIGAITKHFSGVAKELLTDADNFSVTFPVHTPVRIKAAMIGLLFLVDFMAFEGNSEGCGILDFA